MPDSLKELLNQDLSCDSLLECFHGMGELEKRVFATLAARNEPMTIDELADKVNRERSTTYRAVRRLCDAGFVKRDQVNYDTGGYYHIFEPVDADEIATELQAVLNEWYAQMGQLIGEFREKYAQQLATPREFN